MENKKLTPREIEVLMMLNVHFKLHLTEGEITLHQGIKRILDLGWKENEMILHDLGIPKFVLAQMYYKIFGLRNFLINFVYFQRKEEFYIFSC